MITFNISRPSLPTLPAMPAMPAINWEPPRVDLDLSRFRRTEVPMKKVVFLTAGVALVAIGAVAVAVALGRRPTLCLCDDCECTEDACITNACEDCHCRDTSAPMGTEVKTEAPVAPAAAKKTTPAVKKSAPAAKKASPAAKKTTPAAKKAAPAAKKTTPAEESASA